ncbi:hypothetical protein LTR92_000180 [Exophiala xenobiotica]|nr:hypothetical protein LTR92_000180 [Exophiala xenobiotica]
MSTPTHHRPDSSASSTPNPSGNGISEIGSAVQLHLLRALVDVKLARSDTSPDDISHLHMNAVTTDLFWSSSDPDPCSCLLEDLGTFLTQVMGVLSQISASLTNGPHISDYIESYIKSVTKDDDFSDTSVVTFLDQKLRLLQNLSTELDRASNTCEEIWSSRPLHQPSWKLPSHAQLHSQPATPAGSYFTTDSRPLHQGAMPDTYAPTYAGRPAIHSDSKTLSSRGKGKHVCHYGHNCDKGGVQPDGSLVVFERNSAFR